MKMLEQAKHTPTPWLRKNNLIYALESAGYKKGVEQFRNRFEAFIQPGPYTPIAELEANAAFIVQACNSHNELVAALEAMIASFGRYTTNGDGLNAIQLAYDALKKAKGTEQS